MKYILHDTSAMDDELLTEIYIKFGYEGTGLFWAILERIGKQEKPIKTTVLKKQLGVGKRLEKCWYFMEEIGVISSNNGDTFNERILSYSEKYQVKKEKNKEKISQWRDNKALIENVTGYEPICNLPKVKESKVNDVVATTTILEYNKRKAFTELFKRICSWDNQTIEQEVGKFMNKYQNLAPNKSGGLINTWVGNYRLNPNVISMNETKEQEYARKNFKAS